MMWPAGAHVKLLGDFLNRLRSGFSSLRRASSVDVISIIFGLGTEATCAAGAN